jgi:subtilisin family serine protease
MSQQQRFAPIPQAQSVRELSAEETDWGIADIQADQMWLRDGADSGVIFGVIDVGFAPHEDLIFTPTSRLLNVHDHGNHVAGIACAGHNGRGVTGVLPNCFVQAASGDFYPIENDVDRVAVFLTRFSQIIRSIQDFSNLDDAAIVYNLSLGYNWMPNFGINVDEEDAAIYRNFVQMQGESFLRTLARLEREGAVIFSAAGNDSSRLSTPMSAKYASPFNWAAMTASERGDSRAGVIVEAHDRNGDRAVFSNIGGHISCPGVDVLAPVASGDNAYGVMSGTSMASPYCASGFQLLMLTSPSRTSREVLDCFLDAAETVSFGAPRLRLEAAHQLCN